MKNKALLIMAAGLGTRFGEEKQFLPIGPKGEWILDYSIYDALECGFERIIIVVRHNMRLMLEMRYSKLLERHEVIICDQEADTLPRFFVAPENREKPYGTAHALISAAQFIDYPTLVINADDFYGKETFIKMAQFMDTMEEGQIGLACYPLEKTLSPYGAVTRGLCTINENNDLVSVKETYSITVDHYGTARRGDGVALPGEIPTSMNAVAIMPEFIGSAVPYFEDFFNKMEENDMNSELPLPVMIDHMVKDGVIKAKAVPTDADWIGITFAEDIAEVSEKLKALCDAQVYPSPIFD